MFSDKPFAELREEGIFYRGSNGVFRYMPHEDAVTLRDLYVQMAEEEGDRGVPGYADTLRLMAADLTAAIEQMEAADVHS